MADDLNKPSFYPRVGNIRPKSRSPLDSAVDSLKQVAADGRAMEFPFGQYDLSVPTKANRDLSNRMLEREIDLKRQADEAMSPLEKIAGGMQTARLFGSGLTQAINSIPTRIAYGSEAGDKFIQDRMYRPTQEKAYEYADDVGNFLERLETQYKIPPILPEVASLQNVVGPASKQAARAAKQGAKAGAKAGANLVGNAINDAMVYNQGPLAAITPQPMRMFIGPQAKTYDVGRAMKAEEMLKAGKSPEEVWKATGTMIGKDGIPRQEISDAGATFRRPSELKQLEEQYKAMIESGKEKLKPNRTGQKDLFPKQLTEAKKPFREELAALKQDLRGISRSPRTQGVAAQWTLEHPELYRAYPQLADIPVTQTPTYGAEKGSLTYAGNRFDELNVKDVVDPRSVSLHEMQHAIQAIEGMSPGASPEIAFRYPEAMEILAEKRKAASTPVPFEEYAKMGRYNMTDPSDLDRAKRHYVEYANGVANTAKKVDQDLQRRAAHEWYKRQHGEAEARATQERKDLMPTQRLEKFPYESYDEPQDKLLLREARAFEQNAAMPDELIAAREAMRAKAAEEQALLDAYNRATRGMPLDQRPSMEEFRATNMQPSQADLDQMRLELDEQQFAGGGLTKLAKLARAPAKTKAEIRAVAERVAPQVTGEYVRKGPTKAETIAGKTQKQFEREKSLPVDIRPTVEARTPQKIDIESLKGSTFMGIPGDYTVTGKTLHGIGDVKLDMPSPQHGGPLYGLYHDDAHFWASEKDRAATAQNLAKTISQQYESPVIGNYIMMGPEGMNYAQHFADANLQAIDLSKMSKRDVEKLNKAIREGSIESGRRDSFPGIEDKGSAYLWLSQDPALRKHFNQIMQKESVAKLAGLPSGYDVRFAVTEPELRDLERGVTGFSMGQMRPDIPAEGLRFSEHPTYSHDIPGHFLGQSKYPIPYELSFPDTVKAIRENPRQAPHEFGTLQYIGARQPIDQQLIDEIKQYEEMMKELTGKADGGVITVKPKKMANGGEITAEDLEIEERPL